MSSPTKYLSVNLLFHGFIMLLGHCKIGFNLESWDSSAAKFFLVNHFLFVIICCFKVICKYDLEELIFGPMEIIANR